MKNRITNHRKESPGSIADRLLKRYLAGQDTETGFILDVLNISDERTIRHALKTMPTELSKRLADFVNQYRPEMRVFNGRPPKMRTVEIVRRLLRQSNGAPDGGTPGTALTERSTMKPTE